jgi:hypothetical protein
MKALLRDKIEKSRTFIFYDVLVGEYMIIYKTNKVC